MSGLWSWFQQNLDSILWGLLLAILLYWLLRQLIPPKRSDQGGQGGSGSGQGGSDGSDQSSDGDPSAGGQQGDQASGQSDAQADAQAEADARQAEYERQAREREERAQAAREAEALRRDEQVREILEGDPVVAEVFAELAGTGGTGEPRSMARDEELIRRISSSVSDRVRVIMHHAAASNDQMEAIELQTTEHREEVPWQTDDFEVTPIRSFDDLPMVLPEQLAVGDDVFYANLADGALDVTRFYESTTQVRTLVVLVDVSGSMDNVMRDGTMRYHWAAGVVAKLMLRAVAGGAHYLVRFFDRKVGRAYVIKSKEDAMKMLEMLFQLRDSGGGTEIMVALRQAKQDIEMTDAQIAASDVMLVTDGESNMDERWVAANFGKGAPIGLHLAMIGMDNPFLAGIANSHEIYY